MSQFSRTRFYILTLSVLASAAIALCVIALLSEPNGWLITLGLVFTIAILDVFPIKFSLGVEATSSDIVKFASILLFPAPATILGVAFGTAIGELSLKRRWYQKLFNISQMTLTWVVVAAVYHSIHQPDLGYFDSLQNILAVVVAGLTEWTINSCFVALVISLARGHSFTHVWTTSSQEYIYPALSTLAIGIFLAILWRYNPLSILLTVIPVLALRRSYQVVSYLQLQTRDALAALVRVIDERDQHTFNHSARVSARAQAIAEVLKLPREEIETIASAALLHDLGKVGMADDILFSSKRLTPNERKGAERHAEIGAMLLSKFPMFGKGADLVQHHHERFDGQGYPDGLKGEDIPIGARIIAVADSYQAMIEERAYRPALPVEQALQELKDKSGSQFDPQVVQAFLGIVQSEPTEPAAAPAVSGAKV